MASDPFSGLGSPLPVMPAAAAPASQAFYDELIELYADDPVGFCEDILGVTTLQSWQKQLMMVVAHGARRVSVRAGHGVGKSALCAFLVIWHMVCRYPQKTIITAPTAGQLFDALFVEVKFWINSLPPPIRTLFETYSDRIELKANPEASFVSARTSSPERPEALAGVHAEHVLLIGDEASGIPEQVFEAASGSLSSFNACMILIGNPVRLEGLFFRSHHQLKADWHTAHVSCIGNPLVTDDFIRQIATTYGEESNAYRVRVLGEFPKTGDDTLIPLELVIAAQQRDIVLDPHVPLRFGVDIARYGSDRTVLCKRKGNIVVDLKWWPSTDLMTTTGKILHEAENDHPDEICIDSIGLGAGVADRLREQGLNVRDVNVSETTAVNLQANRLRDDLWLQCREWLNTRAVKLPFDDELKAELSGPTYAFTSNGKIKVEGKAEMKKRGLRSPDKADALCLTFAGDAAHMGGRAPSWIPGKALVRRIRGVV